MPKKAIILAAAVERMVDAVDKDEVLEILEDAADGVLKKKNKEKVKKILKDAKK